MREYVIIKLPYEYAKELFKLFDSLNDSLYKVYSFYCERCSLKQLSSINEMIGFVSKVRNNSLVGLNKYNDKKRS